MINSFGEEEKITDKNNNVSYPSSYPTYYQNPYIDCEQPMPKYTVDSQFNNLVSYSQPIPREATYTIENYENSKDDDTCCRNLCCCFWCCGGCIWILSIIIFIMILI